MLLFAALAIMIWAALAHATGGFSGSLFGVRIASRDPLRPLVLALLLLGSYGFGFGWRSADADLEPLFRMPRAVLASAVGAVCLAVFAIGVSFGTFTAGGSDSYGYVSQADLWRHHQLRVAQPFVQDLPMPSGDWTFTPLGYRPAANGTHAIVPTYPPGLPMLMAAFALIAGPQGPYYVVPILAALAVWLCYQLGARAASPLAGATAAIVLASSPVFLFQLMWPMSDIPAAALWTAALCCTVSSRRHAAAAAGLCTALAIAIRPNLAPLAAVLLGYLLWTRRGWRAFILGVLPGVCLVAAVNAYLYGSPLTFGYGNIDAMYGWRNAPINLGQFGGWVLMTQTPLVVMAIVALARPPRPITVLLALFAAGVVFAYLFYAPFDAWWYLRFLLPAMPVLAILTISGCERVLARTPRLLQVAVFSTGMIVLIGHQVGFAVSRDVFKLGPGERRYVSVGEYAAASTPPNAAFISMQHSGSLRHYSGRITLRYDSLPPDWLDRAIAMLRERGYRPYIVLEDWEEPVFRKRFGDQSATGRLAWQPMAEFKNGILVHVYEPP